jgi:hypothetical protein
MMLSSAAGKSASIANTREAAPHNSGLILRKIWLPKLIYTALPWFYVASGIGAFLATLYISKWFWVLPHYVLFSVACLHLGVHIFRRRNRRPVDEA